MHESIRPASWSKSQRGTNKVARYDELARGLEVLLTGESDRTANAANAAAAIYHSLPDLNWAGFYFARGSELVLGPFQGRPACVRIPLGKGVCGTAAAERVQSWCRTSRPSPDTSPATQPLAPNWSCR
jgi:L-methionine (R)-S-oxide reductase